MDSNLRDQLAARLDDYCKRRAEKELEVGVVPKQYVAYGTAGFRGRADQIEHLFYKVGLISALRCLQSEAAVGIMITASHNPIQDNGVKLVDADGSMLETSWEQIVEQFCNLTDKNQILEQIDILVRKFNLNLNNKCNGSVIIAHDTRPSSEALVVLVKQGLDAFNSLVNYIDYGQATTPILHYLVAETNKMETKDKMQVSAYFEQLISGLESIFSRPKECKFYQSNQLVVDCANGVGSEAMQKFCGDRRYSRNLPTKLINIGDGILNHNCGADFVKTNHLSPSGADELDKRYAALDGDADRLVYFYMEKNSSQQLTLKLLDGDKIMSLYALYIRDLLKHANLDDDLTLGIVQTAYANGASTHYMIHELGLKVECVDTGVKNLHKRSLEFDFGIYFEANGHGTIWISPKARKMIKEKSEDEAGDLKRLLSIINNYTGDAISDILVVETILRHYDWDVQRWYQIYEDNPSTLIKVEIKDRNCIKTTNAGRTCIEPPTLQPAIDDIVSKFISGARCFVRASGTENVVRIYAEAKEQPQADELAKIVGEKVKQLCNDK